jgi:hypothetical protein
LALSRASFDSTPAELRRMRRWHTDSFPEVLPPQRGCPPNRGMLDMLCTVAHQHVSSRLSRPTRDAVTARNRRTVPVHTSQSDDGSVRSVWLF